MGDGGKGDARRAMLISAEVYARNFARTFARTCDECDGRGAWYEIRCAKMHGGATCPECVGVDVRCAECAGTGTIED